MPVSRSWKHKCCIVLEGVERLKRGAVERTGHTKAKSELENAAQSEEYRDRAVRLKAKLGSKGKKEVTKQRKWKGYESSFETWCVSGLDFWWRTSTF